MTEVNVYDSSDQSCANNIKNALEQYGTSFFDEFEVELDGTSNTMVKCKIGNNVALTLYTKRDGSVNFSFSFSDRDVLAPSNNPYAYKMYFLQKAIVIICKTSSDSDDLNYRRAIIIAKDTDGLVNVFYISSNSVSSDGKKYSGFPSSTGAFVVCAVTINNDFSSSILIRTNNFDFKYLVGTSRVIANSIPCFGSGTTFDDVYLTTNTDFYSHYMPFQYTLNGELYTGFAGNCVVVKGT
jgi:hypothetical protein